MYLGKLPIAACICLLLFSCDEKTVDDATIMDYDGNLYGTVQIGTQLWMAENLKTTHYLNGDPIPYVISGGEWMNATQGAYTKFNNDDSLVAIYGLLYNWHCATDDRNICPNDWHVPSYGEWCELIEYLGGDSIAGGKMKEQGTEHWDVEVEASNSSGFTFLPSGYRSHSNAWSNSLGIIGFNWTNTEMDSIHAFGMAIRYYDAYVYRFDLDKKTGIPVRCLKD